MSWGMLNLVVLIGYLAFMIYLGIWSERGQKDTASSFLLAGRTATLPWIIMSVFATGVGTLAYIGTVGMIATGGVIDLWFEWFWCVGTPLMTLLFVRKMRTSFGPLTWSWPRTGCRNRPSESTSPGSSGSRWLVYQVARTSTLGLMSSQGAGANVARRVGKTSMRP